MASRGHPKPTRSDARAGQENAGKHSLKNVPAYVNKWLNRNSEHKKVVIANRRKRLNSFPTKFVCTDEEMHTEAARANIRESRSFESMAAITKLLQARGLTDAGERPLFANKVKEPQVG